MKRWLTRLVLLALLAAAGVWGYKYWTREEVDKVTTVEARLGTVEETVSATGTVRPSRTVLVTAEPGVRVVEVTFEEQQQVRKGQLLARLDDADLATQLSQQETNLRIQEENLATAEAQADRLRRLLARGFAARLEVETAEQQVNATKAQIQDRRLSIELIKAKQQRALITAPISGIVTRKYVVVGGVLGDALKAGGPAQPVLIAEIAQVDATEFDADVDQADIPRVRLGQKALVRLDPFSGETFHATTREIAVGSVPDPTGRVRYLVKLDVQAPPGRLKVGMSGTVNFELREKGQVVTIPPPLILQQGDEEFVFVVDKDRARLRRIKTGLHGEDQIEVVSGLEAGEQVIDQGRAKLKDGRRVEVVNAQR